MKLETLYRVTLCWLAIAGLSCVDVAACGLGPTVLHTLPFVSGQAGPSGGRGGDYCPTNTQHPDWRLTSINVRSGSWVDAVDLTFDTGAAEETPIHCGGDGGSPNRNLTIDPDEHIVRLTGQYGNFIDNFTVTVSGSPKGTKTRIFGNASSSASGRFDFQAPDGMYIAGLVVKSHTYLDAIGVFYRKLPNKLP